MDTLTLARSFASLLLDTAAKGTALLLLAALAAWLCRRSSAALRHSIWCMTMGGLLILPVASWALPAWQIPILPPEPLLTPVSVAEVVRLPATIPKGATGEGFDSPVPRHSTAAPTAFGQNMLQDTGGAKRPPVAPEAPSNPPVIEPVSAPVPAIVEPVSEPWTTIEWTSLLVSAGWLVGVSLFGVLLLVGLWRTVKLRRTSLAVSDGEWPGMLVELRQRLGLSRSVELREHAESVVPLTWGIWRPVVLLPKLARAWDEPMRRAVLLHELAHVQRGDVACQVLGRLTCVLYWFHPLAWFALRQLRQEREQACDDAVVGTGEKASDYAEQLLQVARLCCAPRGLSLGVAMAEGSSLERRVKSLFDSARSHGPLTRRVALALFAIGGAILAGLAPIEPTASQAEPPVVEAVEKENVVANPPIETQERILEGDAARQQMELLKPVFGEAKRGIQLGLAVGSLERTFPQGGRIPMWLFYRNLGDKELTFHISQDFMNDPVTVTDANGKPVQVNFVMHWMFIAPLKITLQPGEVWCIATTGLNLGDRMPSIKPVAGKYKLTYPQGIWDVNTTLQLNTDLPFLPTGTPDISGLLKADPKQHAANTPVGQMVETPNWSEHLTTGTIEFEIAPGKTGQLEARVLSAAEKHASDADTVAQTSMQTPSQPAVAQPKVIELLSRFRESRQRLEPLHVQMRHIEEYTDAFRAHHRIQAERQEPYIKAMQKMTQEEFAKSNPHLGSTISAEHVRLSIKNSYDVNRSFAKMDNQTVSDVELFQKGSAYQIRTRRHSNDQALGPLTFPAEPLTAGNLGTTYKEIGFYSWAPQTMPSGMIVYGSQPEYRQITSKPYHTNGANPIPAFSNFVSTRSHDWHPIDAFFFQPPENYRVIGAEAIDGRELVIVEVPVATPYSQGFANEKGESYQLKEVHYYRAWLDPARGSLPVKLLIWHGNEKTDFATHVSQPPRNVMTTQQLTEVAPGGWYPTLTTLDKYDRDEEKMPKAPPSGQGAERDKYLEDIAKVPLVVYERETWKCEFVEVPRTLTDEFFVLPTPAGAKIIDRDREDLIEDYSLGLPVNEFAELGSFLGKTWLMGPLSVLSGPENEGVDDTQQKDPMPVGQNEDTPKAGADVDLDKVVSWGEAVDGLESGFWLTKSEDPRNLRIPIDSLVKYRVVVRNTMDKEIEILVRLLPFDDQDVPYLIPSDKLDSKGKITPPQPAKEFQAQGAAKELYGLDAIQAITLDAGESVLLPECGLYVGKAPGERYPQIADFVPGTHWIVQPLLVHPLTFKERGEFGRLAGRDSVTKIARDGKTRQERVVYVTGSWDQELKPAYAKYHLEVGTLDASAHRNAKTAIWGEVEQGMQCGIRVLPPPAQLHDWRHAGSRSSVAKHQRGSHLDNPPESA